MLITNLKDTTKFKSYGKCNLLRLHLCDETACAARNKIETKDYINEIFAGLMWLG